MLHRFPPAELSVLRRQAMLSPADVRHLTGMSRNTIYYLERGDRLPTTRTLRRLLNRYRGYDLIRRYRLLDPELDDKQFLSRTLDALVDHEVRQRFTPRKYQKAEKD